MKFVVNRKIMLEYLKSMIRVVPRSNSLQQELRGFLVEANEDDGFLYVTATNQEIAIQRKFKPELETGGSFVMDARLLTDILSVLGEDTVSFEELKPGIVVIKSGTCTYTMNVLNSSKYPRPEIPFPDTTVCLSHLRQFYTKTYAAVKSNASDVLKGIHFDIKPDKLRVMSCNPQNVALATKDVPCGGDMKFTLSKETFSLLASAAGDDELEVGLCGHSIVFMKESLLFSARFIEKEYVNVDRIFDNLKTAYVAKVDFEEMKEQIINICDVASMGSQTSYIKAEFLENKVDVSTQNDTGGGKNSFGIVMVDGTAGKTFYYNAVTLKDIFKTVEGTLILRLDVNGYLDVMDRECQYLMMPTPESAVKRQLDKYEENKKKPKKKQQIKEQIKEPEQKAA